MKLILLFTITMFGINILQSQNLDDLKEYISEKIDSNDPIGNYDNYSLFKDDILKIHTKKFAGRNLTEEEFEHLFIYGLEAHYGNDKTGEVWLTEAQVIDLRSLRKVSTTRVKDKNRYYYKVTLFLTPDFLANKFQNTKTMGDSIERLENLQILISDNKDVAIKIKKAFIKIGELLDLEIIDGDFF